MKTWALMTFALVSAVHFSSHAIFEGILRIDEGKTLNYKGKTQSGGRMSIQGPCSSKLFNKLRMEWEGNGHYQVNMISQPRMNERKKYVLGSSFDGDFDRQCLSPLRLVEESDLNVVKENLNKVAANLHATMNFIDQNIKTISPEQEERIRQVVREEIEKALARGEK